MPKDNPKPHEKSWEDVAERVVREQDSHKLTQLTQELIEALDEHSKTLQGKIEQLREEKDQDYREAA